MYVYNGQVLSGLPDVSNEVAGIKIVADTRIQMKAFNKCLLRVSFAPPVWHRPEIVESFFSHTLIPLTLMVSIL